MGRAAARGDVPRVTSLHCDDFPDSFPGRALRDVGELAEVLVRLSRDSETWTTIFECRLCGQVWEELYAESGHGEVPHLRKLGMPD